MARFFGKNSSKRAHKDSAGRPRASRTRPASTGKHTQATTSCSSKRSRPTSSNDDKAPYTTSSDHLSNYFRAMGAHQLFTPEQEIAISRDIEELEIATWATLLSNPASAEYIIDFVEMRLENRLAGFDAVRETAAHARRTRSKTRKQALAEAAQVAAGNIRAMDLDRSLVDEVMAHLTELQVGAARGTKLPFSPRSRSFADCLQGAHNSDRKAARLRNDFVHANLRLVVTMARRYDQGGMPLADLIQEGNLGLMHAVSRFDHRRGLRFSTYACWWIRHAIGRAMADKSRTVRIPVHMLEAQAQLHKTQQRLARELNRKPTDGELAVAANMSQSKIEQMHRYLMGQSVSLDRPAHDHDDRALGEVLPDPQSEEVTAEDHLTTRSLVAHVDRLMGALSPIEADVIRQRFGLRDDHERTFREIGDQYHLSRERIRQIQNTALGKLRAALTNA